MIPYLRWWSHLFIICHQVSADLPSALVIIYNHPLFTVVEPFIYNLQQYQCTTGNYAATVGHCEVWVEYCLCIISSQLILDFSFRNTSKDRTFILFQHVQWTLLTLIVSKYWVSRGWYWLVLGGGGSEQGSTGCQNDELSENIWFAWSKPSNHWIFEEGKSDYGQTDTQTDRQNFLL